MNAKAYELIIDWSDDDQCYVVKVPDLSGCMAHGKTRQQAVEMTEEALKLWIETAKEAGVSVPKPSKFAALA
ncbi:MAG: type II toxin-antitoxin system HicB family antitoxin [Proteobacteria bacterium]|nr:type II toxin-antitoxin system HicB family antitoxin [Pseudomonadota bacterium]NDF00484.1 type II toxin-antitoxin system HicB family antitoxin [Verrucomicrobiota bacterium]